MKIKYVDIITLDAGAPANRAPAHPVYCRITTDDGLYGDGEASVMIMSGGSGVIGVLKDYAGQIIGMDPLKHNIILQKLRRNYFSVNGGPIVQAAISALDTALWDIRGKYFQVPVSTLLGGCLREKLHCYASQVNYGWGTLQSDAYTAEGYAARTAEAVSQGYDAVKADFSELDDTGCPLTTDERHGMLTTRLLDTVEARVAAVRKEIGDGEIIMECHGATDNRSALLLAERLRKYRLSYMEEPESTYLPTLQALKGTLGIPIAAGERLFSLRMFLPFLETNSIDLIQPDLGNAGGISEVMEIARAAALRDIGIQLHCAGSPICMAASVQVEAALPNFVIHEHCCVQERDYIRRLAKNDFMPEHGYITVPQLPGIGNELSTFVLENCEKIRITG